MDRKVSEALGALRARVDAAARARNELDEQLVAAKTAGATFGQLADVLGLRSPQAAQYQHDAAVRRRSVEERVMSKPTPTKPTQPTKPTAPTRPGSVREDRS